MVEHSLIVEIDAHGSIRHSFSDAAAAQRLAQPIALRARPSPLPAVAIFQRASHDAPVVWAIVQDELLPSRNVAPRIENDVWAAWTVGGDVPLDLDVDIDL